MSIIFTPKNHDNTLDLSRKIKKIEIKKKYSKFVQNVRGAYKGVVPFLTSILYSDGVTINPDRLG